MSDSKSISNSTFNPDSARFNDSMIQTLIETIEWEKYYNPILKYVELEKCSCEPEIKVEIQCFNSLQKRVTKANQIFIPVFHKLENPVQNAKQVQTCNGTEENIKSNRDYGKISQTSKKKTRLNINVIMKSVKFIYETK